MAFRGQLYETLPRGNTVAPRFDCTTFDKVWASNVDPDWLLDALDLELRSRRALHPTVSCVTVHTVVRRNINYRELQRIHIIAGK